MAKKKDVTPTGFEGGETVTVTPAATPDDAGPPAPEPLRENDVAPLPTEEGAPAQEPATQAEQPEPQPQPEPEPPAVPMPEKGAEVRVLEDFRLPFNGCLLTFRERQRLHAEPALLRELRLAAAPIEELE